MQSRGPRERRAGTRRLAWSLAALAVVLQLSGLAVSAAGGALDLGIVALFVSAIAVTFSIVGALVASREPSNAIGWIFLGVAVSTGLSSLSRGFVEYRLQAGGDQDPLVSAVAAYSNVSWIPFVLVPATLLLLLFPDGRLPSRRWRLVAWCAIGGIAASLFHGVTTADPFEDFPTVRNPLAIDSPVMEAVEAIGFLLLIVAMGGSALSVVVRYRRGGSVLRQQIKWLAAAGALVTGAFPIVLGLYDVIGADAADAAIMFTVLGLPAAAGVAILRHRLYDIDVVINRALVYGALTAFLAGAYLGSVLLLQLVLSPSSDLAIAGSTLAVAALFRPARARVQALVDRRFYRRRYDAQRTLEAFATRLRDEVSLDAVDSELRVVLAETMQPAHVSIWIRGAPAQ